MNSQHQKIRELLDDAKFHCTSEMRALYMADPPKRLQEMGKEVECGGRCTIHDYHKGGVKMWRLTGNPPEKPHLGQNLQPNRVYERPPTPFVQEFLARKWSKEEKVSNQLTLKI